MAKRWSADSLVAQVLLICLVGTNVEVLGQKGAPPSQGSPQIRHPAQPGSQPSYPGQNPQTNFQPIVKPSYPGQHPQTNVQPIPQPSYPGQHPQTNVQPGSQPSYPGQNPQTNIQPGSQPTFPRQHPQTNIQPGSQPTYPRQHPQTNVQPGSQPSYPGQHPQTNVQQGSQPTYPGQKPQTNVQQGSQPTYPGHKPQTNVQQGSQPTYPGQNPQTNVQQGSQPTYPGQNPQTNVQQGSQPTYPGHKPQTNVQQGSQPTYPGQNPQTNIQPGSQPSYPGQHPPTNIQPGSQPSYPGQNPQAKGQPGSQSSYTRYSKPIFMDQPQQPPLYPKPPQRPQPPTYPQRQQPPTYPQHPQPPTYPQQPQHPQPPTYPQQPQHPQPPTYPQQPQHPQPPTYPQQPQHPQPPTDPKQPKHPQPPTDPKQPQHPQPPTDPKPPQHQQPPQHERKPQHQQPPQHGKHPQIPTDTGVQFCEVEHHVRIQCGGHGISPDGCQAIDCCFDGQQCYFGKAVTVQCTKDAQFIVVVSKDSTLPNLNIETISLIGEGQQCSSVDSNSEFAIFQFPVTYCGSLVTENPGVIIYENRMSSSYEVGIGPNGVITRDSSFELLFQCRYTGTSIETMVIEVLPLLEPPLSVAALGPIRVALRLANGECSTKGCNEVEAAYTSFYTEAEYPVTEVLRDPVFVEVQLLEKTDPNLVLTLGRCWVTNSPNPHTLPQWDLLIDGCPYRDDRYMSSLVPVGSSSGLGFPTHYRRFIFKMFAFVDSHTLEPLKEEVYIHCSTSVCTRAEGRSCEPACFRKKREAKATDQTMTEPKLVVTVGPVHMVDRSYSDTK